MTEKGHNNSSTRTLGCTMSRCTYTQANPDVADNIIDSILIGGDMVSITVSDSDNLHSVVRRFEGKDSKTYSRCCMLGGKPFESMQLKTDS